MNVFKGLLKTGLNKENFGDQNYSMRLSFGEERFHFLLVCEFMLSLMKLYAGIYLVFPIYGNISE